MNPWFLFLAIPLSLLWLVVVAGGIAASIDEGDIAEGFPTMFLLCSGITGMSWLAVMTT